MLLVDPVLVDTVSFFCAQAPRLSALAAIATIMTALRSFMYIISPPFRASCCRHLGGSSPPRNAFLNLVFCGRGGNERRYFRRRFAAAITTGVSTATRSNSSTTSAFLIRMQPWLAGWPICSSWLVPWI